MMTAIPRTLATALALVLLPLPLAPAGRLMAQTTVPLGIDTVEEDWELVVGTPSPDEVGPQITTTMSPVGDNDASCLTFNLNYRDDPFLAGGLQIRAWANKQAVAGNSQQWAMLRTASESITWTQQLRLSGGTLTFSILSGNSTTWGKFGQIDLLNVSVGSGLSTLSGYNPALSAECSGPTWQSNRVTSMRLAQVRYYRGGTLVGTDSTPRVVIPAP